MWKDLREHAAHLVFFACALASVAALCVITFFIMMQGLPGIAEIGVGNFLLGMKWAPGQGQYGIFPMIVASALTTAGAFFVGSFVGKWAALFLAFYCPRQLHRILKPMVELLAGIPSVIYGFFGVVVIVPLIRDHLGGPGKSMLASIIILSVMILPTIINMSESSLRAVPRSYYEGAVALGSTHSEAVFQVMLPAARSGVTASYILGIGRALGETMAVILVAGNNPNLPFSSGTPLGVLLELPKAVLKPVSTLTTGIALEMGYASGLHQSALFGIGVVLFVLIFLLNILLSMVIRKK